MSTCLEWHTFRDIDHHLGLPKGSAFRAFKRLRPRLREDEDFRVLEAGPDAQKIATLRQAGRIYAASINVVLLGTAARTRIEAELGPAADTGTTNARNPD